MHLVREMSTSIIAFIFHFYYLFCFNPKAEKLFWSLLAFELTKKPQTNKTTNTQIQNPTKPKTVIVAPK